VTSQSRSIRPRRQEEFWFEGHGAVECFSEISISLTNNSAILAFLIWEVDASSAKMQEQNTKDPRPIWSKSGLGLRRTNGSSVNSWHIQGTFCAKACVLKWLAVLNQLNPAKVVTLPLI